MKRLLVVTYYWPPSSGSGVQRWLKFSKYLPHQGWQPVIYTPENPDFAIQDESLLSNIPEACEVIKRPIWEPYKVYRKLGGSSGGQGNTGMAPRGGLAKVAGWIRGSFFLPDPRRFWVSPSVRFLREYLRANPVDAMVTTGPPHSMHLIGLGLKAHFPQLPWLADMRDPWATFDIHTSFMNSRSQRKNARMQQDVLDHADRVVVTSPGARSEFASAPPDSVVVIHNGFDTDDFPQNSEPPSQDPTDFHIIHSGLLNAIRDVPAFWRALARTAQSIPEFAQALRLELIGNVDPDLAHRLQKHPDLSPALRLRGWLSHGDLLRENKRASAFLVIVNQSENARSQLPGKIYEYLALGKPILALCPLDSSLAELIQETRSGVVLDPQDEHAMIRALTDLWENRGSRSSYAPNMNAIQQFTREALTHKLVRVLEELTS